MYKKILFITVFLSSFLLHCFDDNPVTVVKKTFDPNNKIRKIAQYNAQDKLEFYLSFTYDTDGRKKELRQFSGENKLLGYYALAYSADDKTIAKQTHYTIVDDEKQVAGSHTFEYDDNGNETKMSLFDASGALQEYYTSEYDSLDRIIGESLFSPSGELKKYCEYVYDGKNVNTVTNSYDGNGTLLTSSKNEYDSEGRIVKETVQYEGKIVYYLRYEY